MTLMPGPDGLATGWRVFLREYLDASQMGLKPENVEPRWEVMYAESFWGMGGQICWVPWKAYEGLFLWMQPGHRQRKEVMVETLYI